jgi:hypothetical protein
MSDQPAQGAELRPVGEAMLRHASERAANVLAAARAVAEATVTAARTAAQEAIESARADGIEQAQPVAAAELNRSRQAARSVELGAESAARDQIRRRIRAAVLALHEDADYPQLRARLSAKAAVTAGSGAQITEDPRGGVIARAGGVVVDCSLPRLADRAIAALDARITELCGP